MKSDFVLEQLINRLKKALSDELPGVEAQYQMAPVHRQRILTTLMEETYKPSAVMILFCEDEAGHTFIPLTERVVYDGAHSGQVSLPGGKFEAGDLNLMNTAIRECYEEIGVNEIDVLGKLTPLYIPVSRFLVHPFIGVCKIRNPHLKIQEREVKTILRLSPEVLLNDEIVKNGGVKAAGLTIKAPWYDVEGAQVWGATAMILSELKTLMQRATF